MNKVSAPPFAPILETVITACGRTVRGLPGCRWVVVLQSCADDPEEMVAYTSKLQADMVSAAYSGMGYLVCQVIPATLVPVPAPAPRVATVRPSATVTIFVKRIPGRPGSYRDDSLPGRWDGAQ